MAVRVRSFARVGRFLLLTAAALALEKPSRRSQEPQESQYHHHHHQQQQQQQQQQHPKEPHSFPAIYTAQYLYSIAENPETQGNHWLREFDLIRNDCEIAGVDGHETDNNHSNNTNNYTNATMRCQGDFLVRSHEEYLEMVGELQQLPHRSNPEVHSIGKNSLQYNASLTEQWIHPRNKVADAAAAATQRRQRQRTLRDRIGESSRITEYSTIASPYDCYYSYQGTMDWIRDVVARYSVSSHLEVTWTDIGDSWKKTQSGDGGDDDGHDIYALTLTGKPASMAASGTTTATTSAQTWNASSSSEASSSSSPIPSLQRNNGSTGEQQQQQQKAPEKAPFLIVTSTHAREYTPPILVRLWLEDLIEKVEASDPAALSMLETTRIHWIPYLNPDGRLLAETSQPFRRKNLNDAWTGNVQDSLVCPEDAFGVDLNRNCPFEWGKRDGSSTQPCSSFARGSRPGSEPEIQALVNYGRSIFPAHQRSFNALVAGGGDYREAHTPGKSVEESSRKWRGYNPQTTRGVFVDVHSYGKVYIYPWGNMNSISPNDSAFRSAMGHVESLTNNGALGPGPEHYGVASGATDDWAYGELGAFGMTWELGSSFHEPCDDFAANFEKHFGAFDYLGSIAPFPFALGKGPIVQTIKPQHTQLYLYYRHVRDEWEEEEDDLDAIAMDSLSNDNNVTMHRGEFFSTTKEIVRMSSNEEEEGDWMDGLDTIVTVQLPDVIPSHHDAIDFEDFETDGKGNDDGNDGTWTDAEEDPLPSFVAKIRIFYGGINPLVGAQTANSTFADGEGNESGGNHDYWESVLVHDGDSEEVGTSLSSYKISITKNQLWEAFGDKGEPEGALKDHTLYFQAMDNVGNVGPVGALRLSIAVLEEPVAPPVDHSSVVDGSCIDDATYRRNNSLDHGCDWVAERFEIRCAMDDGQVFAACPGTCNPECTSNHDTIVPSPPRPPLDWDSSKSTKKTVDLDDPIIGNDKDEDGDTDDENYPFPPVAAGSTTTTGGGVAYCFLPTLVLVWMLA